MNDRPKYAILILDNIRLVKLGSKDEAIDMAADLLTKGIPFDVLKDHGDVYSKMETHDTSF